jgi:hypothetical protein
MTSAREMEVADIAIGEIDVDAARWAIPGSRTKDLLINCRDLMLASERWSSSIRRGSHAG